MGSDSPPDTNGSEHVWVLGGVSAWDVKEFDDAAAREAREILQWGSPLFRYRRLED